MKIEPFDLGVLKITLAESEHLGNHHGPKVIFVPDGAPGNTEWDDLVARGMVMPTTATVSPEP